MTSNLAFQVRFLVELPLKTMRQFKPKNSLDCFKLGGRSKLSHKRCAVKSVGKNKKITEENEKLAEKAKKIPKGKWFK